MSVHAIDTTAGAVNHELVTQAKIDLAAAHRLACYHDLDESIDNHFTVTVPGRDDRFLILPFGLHWSEATASAMIIYDAEGATVEGDGICELSAHCIHTPIHQISGAQVVLHTHQTWALALNMIDDNRLVPASQTAAFFHDRVAYDDVYSGTADFTSEGERLAGLLGDCHTIFMKNHGVLVIGDTVAQAYRRLYMLERVCRAQVLAMSTGRPLAALSDEVIAGVKQPVAHDTHDGRTRERLFFEAMKRVIDRQMPGYAD